MKELTKILELLAKYQNLIADKYNVKNLSVFGSYVRHQQGTESDLDILVEYNELPGLIKYIELENYLSDILETKVDLVIKDSLKPKIAEHILSEAVQV
jgi:hypothetical protein